MTHLKHFLYTILFLFSLCPFAAGEKEMVFEQVFSTNSSPAYHYFLRDHLGSVHVVFYKFCGKELDRMHGLDWYDSQARMYDPVLNRWHTQDAKAENYYSWSPYAYCMGNPVNAIDPDGNSVWTKIAKASFKIGKQVVKHGAKALTEGATYAQAVADITDDINTLTDSEASTGSKVWAAISLASEALPLSINDVKDVGKFTKTITGGKKTKTIESVSQSPSKVRFVTDPQGNTIDINATPRGSYLQPNGSITDILQGKQHYNKTIRRNDGYSHTHPIEQNISTNGLIFNKKSTNTHPPTYEEIKKIEYGEAKRIR